MFCCACSPRSGRSYKLPKGKALCQSRRTTKEDNSQEVLLTAKQHIQKSAALRGQKKFGEAIAEIENNRSSFDDISLLPALLQAFKAAHEAGNEQAAQSYAKEIRKIDPDVPSIQSYL